MQIGFTLFSAFSAVCLVMGLFAGRRLFRYLRRNQHSFWSSLLMAFDETWGWLPGSDKVKELEKQKAQREAFLKHRRERKPGKLTDDF